MFSPVNSKGSLRPPRPPYPPLPAPAAEIVVVWSLNAILCIPDAKNLPRAGAYVCKLPGLEDSLHNGRFIRKVAWWRLVFTVLKNCGVTCVLAPTQVESLNRNREYANCVRYLKDAFPELQIPLLTPNSTNDLESIRRAKKVFWVKASSEREGELEGEAAECINATDRLAHLFLVLGHPMVVQRALSQINESLCVEGSCLDIGELESFYKEWKRNRTFSGSDFSLCYDRKDLLKIGEELVANASSLAIAKSTPFERKSFNKTLRAPLNNLRLRALSSFQAREYLKTLVEFADCYTGIDKTKPVLLISVLEKQLNIPRYEKWKRLVVNEGTLTSDDFSVFLCSLKKMILQLAAEVDADKGEQDFLLIKPRLLAVIRELNGPPAVLSKQAAKIYLFLLITTYTMDKRGIEPASLVSVLLAKLNSRPFVALRGLIKEKGGELRHEDLREFTALQSVKLFAKDVIIGFITILYEHSTTVGAEGASKALFKLRVVVEENLLIIPQPVATQYLRDIILICEKAIGRQGAEPEALIDKCIATLNLPDYVKLKSLVTEGGEPLILAVVSQFMLPVYEKFSFEELFRMLSEVLCDELTEKVHPFVLRDNLGGLENDSAPQLKQHLQLFINKFTKHGAKSASLTCKIPEILNRPPFLNLRRVVAAGNAEIFESDVLSLMDSLPENFPLIAKLQELIAAVCEETDVHRDASEKGNLAIIAAQFNSNLVKLSDFIIKRYLISLIKICSMQRVEAGDGLIDKLLVKLNLPDYRELRHLLLKSDAKLSYDDLCPFMSTWQQNHNLQILISNIITMLCIGIPESECSPVMARFITVENYYGEHNVKGSEAVIKKYLSSIISICENDFIDESAELGVLTGEFLKVLNSADFTTLRNLMRTDHHYLTLPDLLSLVADFGEKHFTGAVFKEMLIEIVETLNTALPATAGDNTVSNKLWLLRESIKTTEVRSKFHVKLYLEDIILCLYFSRSFISELEAGPYSNKSRLHVTLSNKFIELLNSPRYVGLRALIKEGEQPLVLEGYYDLARDIELPTFSQQEIIDFITAVSELLWGWERVKWMEDLQKKRLGAEPWLHAELVGTEKLIYRLVNFKRMLSGEGRRTEITFMRAVGYLRSILDTFLCAAQEFSLKRITVRAERISWQKRNLMQIPKMEGLLSLLRLPYYSDWKLILAISPIQAGDVVEFVYKYDGGPMVWIQPPIRDEYR
jgi:hypothetical protein